MTDKIKEWLEKQGYPLEMKVAKELNNQGFESFQSHYYKDPETEKQREIDVVANYRTTNGLNVVNFQFIIECKNNQDKPWIAFSSEENSISRKSYIAQRPCGRIGSKYLEHLSQVADLKTNQLFNLPSSFAYNITQAFETSSDRVYTALMSVVNAIKYRRERINSEIAYDNFCEIYLPTIVIGGKLFDSFLNRNNENCVEEIDHKYLLWRNKVLDVPNVIIEVTTFDSFKNRLPIIKTDIENLIKKQSGEFFNITHSNFTPYSSL